MKKIENILKGMSLQTIGGAIAALIAIVGLIAGVATGSSSGSANKAIDNAVEEINNPQYVKDYRAAVVEYLTESGYTVTNDANKQAQASAEGAFEGDSYKYDTAKFTANMQTVSPAFFPASTKAINAKLPEVRAQNIPAGSKGEAGVGIEFGQVQSSVVILMQK